MFVLQKKSQVVTVDPALSVAEYERRLNDEGLTGGYRPLPGYQIRLSQCLEERVPNIFFLRYGGIEELCVGGKIQISKNRTFTAKTYPRSATGADLRRVLIGSRGIMGKFREVTFRVYPLPEHELWGLAFFVIPETAFTLVSQMLGLFIRPLFLKVLDEDEGAGLLRSLNRELKETMILAFKLTGLKSIVEAEREVINGLEEEKVSFYWPSHHAEIDILDKTIVTMEAYLTLVQKWSPLVGGNVSVKETDEERALRKYFESNPV